MSDVSKQCGLSGTSRTDIFHDIAVDELTKMINMEILASISATNYQKFIDFCDQVSRNHARQFYGSIQSRQGRLFGTC